MTMAIDDDVVNERKKKSASIKQSINMCIYYMQKVLTLMLNICLFVALLLLSVSSALFYYCFVIAIDAV